MSKSTYPARHYRKIADKIAINTIFWIITRSILGYVMGALFFACIIGFYEPYYYHQRNFMADCLMVWHTIQTIAMDKWKQWQ